MIHDLRSPNDMDDQRRIEAIPEAERTDADKKRLAAYLDMANYRSTALGDK